MDIMELGAIGELVGGVAVIGSLLYVGLQVRQSNIMERNESLRAASRDSNALVLQLVDSAFSKLVRRGLLDFTSLTKDEQLQLSAWLTAYSVYAGSTMAVNEAGSINTTVANAAFDFLVSMLRTPGGARWWSETKPFFDPFLVSLVDGSDTGPEGVLPITETLSWFSNDLSQRA